MIPNPTADEGTFQRAVEDLAADLAEQPVSLLHAALQRLGILPAGPLPRLPEADEAPQRIAATTDQP